MKLRNALLAATILFGVPLLRAPQAQATISSPQVSITANGNGSTTVWPYPFIIPFQSNGTTPAVTVTTTTGGVTTTVPSNQYSIVGVGSPSGGNVTYPLAGSPIASGTTITIRRSLAYIQPTAVPNTTFYPHTVEQVADNLDMQIQQIAALIGSSGGGGGGCSSSCVNSFNTRTGDVTLSSSDVIGALGYVPGGSGVASFNTRVGSVTLTSGDVTTALGYTPPSSAVSSFNTRTGAVSLTSGDVTGALTYTPANKAGDTLTGKLTLPASITGSAYLNLPQGAVPTTPNNGDVWTTATGVFAQIAGTTQQLASTAGAVSSFNTRTGAITLTSPDVTGALGFSPVQSFNTRTGVVTLTGTDVTTALGGTPLQVGNIIAGTNITLGVAGNNITVNAAGAGGSQNVTYFNNISSLRANTSITVPNAIVRYWGVPADNGGGVFYYDSADTTTADNSCTVILDASAHRWKRIYQGPVDAHWCGARGDGSTDDTTALQAAMNTNLDVLVGPMPTCYIVSGSLTLHPRQTLSGNSMFTSCIKSSTAATPIVIVPTTVGPSYYTNLNMTIRDLMLDRGTAATPGGDGIYLGSYVNNMNIQNVLSTNQYNGLSVHSTDSSFINDSVFSNNYNHGIAMVSNSYYPTLQWSLRDVYTDYNGTASNVGHGIFITATAGAGPTSVGTFTNVRTFANTGNAFRAIGLNSTDAVNGIRIDGGFFGQDGDNEIYLDTYGNGHVIAPTYVELAGTSYTGRTLSVLPTNVGAGIYISANNGYTQVNCGVCNQNSYDGILTSATYTNITGGMYTNNGLAAGAVGLGRANGIYIFGGGGAVISGVKAGNTVPVPSSGTQQYGIASTIDQVAVAGCDLRGFRTGGSYYAFSGGIANTQIAGCLPAAANTSGGGGGSYMPLTGGTFTGPVTFNSAANLTVNAPTTIANSVTVSGAQTISAPSSSLSVLTMATGSSASVGGGLTVTGAMSSASVSTGAVSGSTGTFSGTMQSLDAYVTRSLGINAAPDTIGAHITGPGGGLAFAGGVNVNITGALAVTGNVQTQSLYATTAAGIGTAPSTTPGRLDVGGITVGSPIGGYLAGNVNAAGTVYGGTGVVSYGALAWTSCAYSISAGGACLGSGSINASLGVYLNGTAYTNP